MGLFFIIYIYYNKYENTNKNELDGQGEEDLQ